MNTNVNNDNVDEYEQEQERRHFCRIVGAFKAYKKHSLQRIQEKKKYIGSLPSSHQSLLTSYLQHLDDQIVGILHNTEIINLITKDVENMFENVHHEVKDLDSVVLLSDIEKVQSTLKHIVRDWSSEGEEERSLCYAPIISKVESLFPPDKVNPADVQIVVPGAGLGRLAYDLAKKGYTCQGNEFSLFMLFASNFVLNRIRGVNTLQIYPWVHSGCNLLSNEDQMRLIPFPDVEPAGLPPNSQFTMAAGDFLEIYTEDNAWDCVASCYFIDCANNIVSFIEAIYKILKPGGYWVNLGPLLYHFADQPGENSIEPSYDVIKQIIKGIGFNLLEEKTGLRTTYTQHEKSLLSYEYSSVFFVAQKPS